MNGYVITDTNQTIWVRKEKNGSYSLTTDRGRALIFDTKPAADAVFKSNLSKLIKSKGVMVKSINVQVAGTTPVVSQATPVVEIDTAKYIISVFTDAAEKLNCRHKMLDVELSKYDRQITDIEHYIEFNTGKLDACKGYKAYKMLQDVLVERRKIKNELKIIQAVKDRVAFSDDIGSINAKIEQLEHQQYVPREFPHLFNGGVK